MYGHCDLGPWNIIHKDGKIEGFIDWEVAGPVDPLVDLAYACWLNAQLYDDELSAKNLLPSLAKRCDFINIMLKGYGLKDKTGFVTTMIETAVHDVARQAIENGITPDGDNPDINWAFAWRARSASWMINNKDELIKLIELG